MVAAGDPKLKATGAIHADCQIAGCHLIIEFQGGSRCGEVDNCARRSSGKSCIRLIDGETGAGNINHDNIGMGLSRAQFGQRVGGGSILEKFFRFKKTRFGY